jgi:hypothetical protein
MAFQLYVQPRGGENIARGIEQAGAAIGQGFRDMRDRKEQRKQEAQITEGFKRLVGADPDLARELGINDETDWDNFSPNQVKGMYEGIKLQAATGAALNQRLQASELQRRMGQQQAEDQLLAEAGMYARSPDGPWSAEATDRYAPILANPAGRMAAGMAAEGGYAPSGEFLERYGPPWQPTAVNVGGNPMLMTSNKSAIPVPAHMNRGDPGTQPTISQDGGFYRSGAGDWKPIPGKGQGGMKLEPGELERYTRRRREIQQTIDKLEQARSDASSWSLFGKSKADIDKELQQLENQLAGIITVLAGSRGNEGLPPTPQQAGDLTDFATLEEAEAAVAAGSIQPGTIITINGRRAKVD